jgi:DNA-directed RNA polymerase subunit alpha
MHRNLNSLIKPKKLEFEAETLTNFYGKFSCEPLERGFGITIGNSLRRILLSSLQGAAIVSVRIDGVLHEFSSIPGVVEDVTDIILNLKGVLLKLHGTESQIIHIDASGEREVKAGDIITNGKVEILNPDWHIATLNKDARFKMEMKVALGKGYVPAERNKDENDPIGTIPIDSIFSPIKKVSYTVTNARVGQITDYDRLTMEIYTNGSIRPDEAVAKAAQILRDQLSIFVDFKEGEDKEEDLTKEEKDKFNDNLYKTVDELELSVRAANCLKNANIRLIGELVQKSENDMLKTKNFGRKSLNEIKEVLAEMNLRLGMKLEGFDPSRVKREKEQEI